jgi:uncharacterized membrane protein YbaN (DUF454 family)
MRRWAWFLLGWTAVAVGAIGVVVPGVPTTGPFVLAAACFARSSPRFERWVLGLPAVGRMVRDHRAGLGMPRRAKFLAIGMMLTACSLSAAVTGSRSPPVAAAVVVAGLVGTWYVGWRVPTRESVLAVRAGRVDATGAPAATAPATTATAGADPTTEPAGP